MVIRWDDLPPRVQMVQIMSAKKGRPLVVLAAGPVIGVYTHFIDGRSVPCQCDEGTCQKTVGQAPRWKGFLPAYLPNGRKVGVEVTIGSVRQLPLLVTGELTGRWVRFQRSGEKSNGPLYVEVIPERDEVPSTPSFDLKATLLAMWGISE